MHLSKYIVIISLAALFAAVGCGSGDRPDPLTGTDSDTGTEPYLGAYTDDPAVPQTCAEATAADNEHASSVGCTFYSVSLDTSAGDSKFGIVLGNVNYRETAHYWIEGSVWDNESYLVTNEGEWRPIAEGDIAPLKQKRIDHWSDTYQDDDDQTVTVERTLLILLNQFSDSYLGKENTKGTVKQGAYRIRSTVPITAYQFSPLVNPGVAAASSDASMLIPVSSWAEEYQVVGYRTSTALNIGSVHPNNAQMELAYFAVVAHEDNTEVTIDTTAKTRIAYAGWYDDTIDVPETPAGGQIVKTLNSADVMYVHASDIGASLSGTKVRSNAGHPIAVFSGHQCAFIPEQYGACDNLEEQIPGTEYWGDKFVAARYPNRNRVNYTDPVLWQIHASKDNTELRFAAADGVKGLPEGPITLNAGEYHEMLVYGGVIHPGDFAVKATEPVAVLSYMTGVRTTRTETGQTSELGDPAMAYLPPSDQFVGRYIVNIPQGWAQDYMVVTREAGVPVLLDGVEVDETLFRAIPKVDDFDKALEVARIPTSDGNRILESSDRDKGIGLIVVGMDEGTSYAYTGGMGFEIINPVL